ncbi:hypothetical protein [Puia sp.]|jgi:hypothetical protein|uniref:hypothetical protein n=1 Tax=Puia sp. TaxID=2045100 RepID=UPI002F40190E
MRLPLLLLLSFLSLGASAAEDLNGIWKGTLTQGPGGCYPSYFLELQITVTGDRISGKAYDYYDKAHFVKMSFTGRYNAQTHRMVLIEDRVLEADIPGECQPCVKTYDLNYARNGALEELTGDWKGVYSDRHLICPPGKIKLQKAASSDFPVDVEQNDTLAGIQASLRLQPREKEVVKTVTVKSSQIKIELYDNAEIDHDTVTVFINNKILLYRQMLTDKPLTINFNAFPNLPYELVMYADNLGDIPPNTALMMITAGDQKFEVFLSSTETKSATVKFIYRP